MTKNQVLATSIVLNVCMALLLCNVPSGGCTTMQKRAELSASALPKMKFPHIADSVSYAKHMIQYAPKVKKGNIPSVDEISDSALSMASASGIRLDKAGE